VTLELERERVVQELCTAYANDQLSTGELEARLEKVYVSVEREQLQTLLQGIPGAARAFVAPLATASPRVTSDATAAEPRDSGARRGLPADERRYVAIFAEVKKEGAWTPTSVIRARAVFGSVLLDLREAAIPIGGIDLDIDVMFGDAKVLLPPGVGADVDCTSVLGSVEDKSRPAFPGAPTLRVRGGAIFGSVSVITKVPKKERVDSWRRQLKSWLGGDETS
jgi:hypothetical protein